MNKKIMEIITKTKNDLLKKKGLNSEAFYKAITKSNSGKIAIICEIKIASPTEGNLGKTHDISPRAKAYEKAGADCISVVTEKHYFKGDPKFVKQIKTVTSLPILQKDFITDPYQIYEAKILGADAILLISRIVSQKELLTLVNIANEIGIEPVVEINSNEDLKKATSTSTRIIAVNARDLDTFEVDINKACLLLERVPSSYIKLGFSGISSKKDVKRYQKAGADAILIGTSLMKTNNISEFIERIRI